MEYRAVGNRCAVDLDSLFLPISNDKALNILTQKGFKVLEVDLVGLARRCIVISSYRRGAKLSEAPTIVDCSSLIKWLYGQRGIWLPRRSIQQRELGEHVSLNDVSMGDVIFTRGAVNYYHSNPRDSVGHVGMVTGEGTVIHAANSRVGIIESSLDNFLCVTKFRGIRRYVPKDQTVLTLETPTDREVETADDIRWIVLQSLPKK